MKYSTIELKLLRVVQKTMHSRLTCWVNRLLPVNFKIELIPEKKWSLPTYCRDYPQEKHFQTQTRTTNLWLPRLTRFQKILMEKLLTVKKNCIDNDLLIDNPVDVYSVYSFTNLDSVNEMVGRNEKLQHIQRSFFVNVLNYVTDTLQFCNSNHLRSMSCTSSCIPLNFSKIKFNQDFLSDESFFSFTITSFFRIKIRKINPNL